MFLTAPAAADTTLLVSADAAGVPANANSNGGGVSEDGRFVVFDSYDDSLVPGDANGVADVYVKDLQTGAVVRVSSAPSGAAGNNGASNGVISGDGLHVVFQSSSTDLVPGDTNGMGDIFVRNLVTGAIARVNTDSAGNQAGAFSGGHSISRDGRYVAFYSYDHNLVPGDLNGKVDVFRKDTWTGQIVLVSVDSTGDQGNDESTRAAISADGSRVAFESLARNLAPGDTNQTWDIFVRDLSAGTTVRVSVGPGGTQSNERSFTPSISGDGLRVVFVSLASNLVAPATVGFQAFVHDLATGTTALVSESLSGSGSAGGSSEPRLSANGAFVAFYSAGGDLVPGDTNGLEDVFVRDLAAGTTVRVSLRHDDGQADGASYGSAISGDGRYVVFFSMAPDLVAGIQGEQHVYVRDRICDGDVAAYCTAKLSSAACLPSISWSGSPSASAPSGFVVSADQLLGGMVGVFFYSTGGAAAQPFQGGTLCLQTPVVRIGQQVSTGGGPCGGHMEVDFNVHVHSGADPALAAGASFWGQFWSRDPGDPFGTSLSNAVQGTLCP